MTFRSMLMLLCVAAIQASGCGDDGGSEPADAANLAGGVTSHVTVGGIEREFIVYLPTADLTTRDLPVVFVLHGTSQDGVKFAMDSQWRQKADAEHLIAVFPTALHHCYEDDKNLDGTIGPGEVEIVTKWADGKLGDPARMPLCTPAELAAFPADKQALADHALADDLGFFDAMIAYLGSSYSIDSKRIYVTGFSNGGGMASRLALERSTALAAVAASSGFVTLPGVAARPLSVIATVGSRDNHINPELGVMELPLQESLLTDIPRVQTSVIDPFLAMLQLSNTYTYDERTVSGKKVIRFRYATSTAGASNTFQFLVIEDLGHEYADGSNHPLAYVDAFWPEFESQQLP